MLTMFHSGLVLVMKIDWEWIEERAAILEHDAGLDREVADRLARIMWVSWGKDGGVIGRDGIAAGWGADAG
jgi:Mn-dependent DtxR family transcriptional regulator